MWHHWSQKNKKKFKKLTGSQYPVAQFLWANFFFSCWTNNVTKFPKVTWVISLPIGHLRFSIVALEILKLECQCSQYLTLNPTCASASNLDWNKSQTSSASTFPHVFSISEFLTFHQVQPRNFLYIFISFYTVNVWSPETAVFAYNYEDDFWTVVSILATSNHSLNFYLYILSGTQFRNQFLIMIKRCKPKKLIVTKSRSGIFTISTHSSGDWDVSSKKR